MDEEQAPERELVALLLAARDPGAARVRRELRLTLDHHFRAVLPEPQGEHERKYGASDSRVRVGRDA